ncbi:MAG: hypothetical protein Kow0069_27140 [Promethearchaeota archaeon]
MNAPWYFSWVLPVALTVALAGKRVAGSPARSRQLALACALAAFSAFGRLSLLAVADEVGAMPHLEHSAAAAAFYLALAVFGVAFSAAWVKWVDPATLRAAEGEDAGRRPPKPAVVRVAWGLAGFPPVLAMLPLVAVATGLSVDASFSWPKLVNALSFGALLGGVYEELVFRGAVHAELSRVTTSRWALQGTAAAFWATHLGYLSFDGWGAYYWFVGGMALVLGVVRERGGLLAAGVLHGGVVTLLVFLT